MKSKIISYIAILTVFLVGTVCFLPQKTFCANDCNVHISFVYGEKGFVYDLTATSFDKGNHDVLLKLKNRAFFDDLSKKRQRILEVKNLGFDLVTATNYVLIGLEKIVAQMQKEIEFEKQDSKIFFNTSSNNLFIVTDGKDGVRVDLKKLYAQIYEGLTKSSNFEIKVPIQKEQCVTKKQNLANTMLKSYFCTSYLNSTADRKHNVSLALSKFDGMVIAPGQSVSFNKIVGKRTEQNGYKNAKVILQGKYVDGIGGGVCQASTTLYNAVLMAGLQVDEWHRHTLSCSYARPSFDAMVNDNGADFVFTNDTQSNIYVKTVCNENEAKVWIYGAKNHFETELKSVVKKQMKARVEKIVDEQQQYTDKVFFEDQQYWLQKPTDGIESEGYLVCKKDGVIIEERLLRKDVYKVVDGILVVGKNKRSE